MVNRSLPDRNEKILIGLSALWGITWLVSSLSRNEWISYEALLADGLVCICIPVLIPFVMILSIHTTQMIASGFSTLRSVLPTAIVLSILFFGGLMPSRLLVGYQLRRNEYRSLASRAKELFDKEGEHSLQ